MKLTKKMAQVELKMSKERVTGKMGLSWVVHCMEHFGIKEMISDGYWERKKSNREIGAYKKIMTSVMSSVSGGERVEDVEILRADKGLVDSLGWEEIVGADAMLDYMGNARANGKNRKVNEEMVIKTMKKIEEELTYDNDATYLDSNKKSAAYSYKGRKQFSGLIGCIDEAGMINTVEYRRGNVSPATGIFNQLRKACHQAKKAGKLIKKFRSDSAADQDKIFGYCDKEGIEYYVSLNQNKGIKRCIEEVKERRWKKMKDKYSKNTDKRWTVTEYRRSKGYKIRILILRWPNPDPDLFDSSPYCYHAITTNNWEIKPMEWLEMHNGRMGSIEHMNDEIKNELGCNYTPSHEFEKNRGYFLLGVMAYNMLQILKRFYMGVETISWTVKRIKNYFIHVCGKIVKTGRKFYCNIVNTTQETFELFRNCKSKLIINGY